MRDLVLGALSFTVTLILLPDLGTRGVHKLGCERAIGYTTTGQTNLSNSTSSKRDAYYREGAGYLRRH